jgi:hypothetical protein
MKIQLRVFVMMMVTNPITTHAQTNDTMNHAGEIIFFELADKSLSLIAQTVETPVGYQK